MALQLFPMGCPKCGGTLRAEECLREDLARCGDDGDIVDLECVTCSWTMPGVPRPTDFRDAMDRARAYRDWQDSKQVEFLMVEEKRRKKVEKKRPKERTRKAAQRKAGTAKSTRGKAGGKIPKSQVAKRGERKMTPVIDWIPQVGDKPRSSGGGRKRKAPAKKPITEKWIGGFET